MKWLLRKVRFRKKIQYFFEAHAFTNNEINNSTKIRNAIEVITAGLEVIFHFHLSAKTYNYRVAISQMVKWKSVSKCPAWILLVSG